MTRLIKYSQMKVYFDIIKKSAGEESLPRCKAFADCPIQNLPWHMLTLPARSRIFTSSDNSNSATYIFDD
jgi:hypothetical protein